MLQQAKTKSCTGYVWHLTARWGLWEQPITSLAPCRLRRGRVPSQAITCSSSHRGERTLCIRFLRISSVYHLLSD